ncbi:hypothetical protein D3C79_962820 [compost metagenome]
MVCEAFSAMPRALNCGRYRFISAGASVPGVNWNSSSMPATVRVSYGLLIRSLGSIRVMLPPVANALPIPVSTWPWAPRGRYRPNWYWARRLMALPA